MSTVHSSNAADPDPRQSVGRSVESLLILIAVTILTTAVLRSVPLQSANDRSRWATVWSLVERQTYRIDEIDQQRKWSTIDKVRVGEGPDGPWHFYSSKPPLLSTLVAGLYAIERATLGYGLFNDAVFVSRLLLLFVNVVPFAVMLCSLRRVLNLIGATAMTTCFVLAASGFGSLLNPYFTTLNNHTPAAVCLMLAVEAALRMMMTRRGSDGVPALRLSHPAKGRWQFVGLGFFAALTACFELPAALVGVLAFVLAVRCDAGKTVKWFIPAAAIPLLAFFITNWIATGGIKPFYAGYGSALYVYEHNGVPSYWSNPRELDANTETWPVYLMHCLIGHHGLLSLSPVLLLAIAGCLIGVSTPRYRERWLMCGTTLLLTIATLGFYLTRTENYNYGGNSFALRWMLWLSPLWWLMMVPALECCSRRWKSLLSAALLAASIGTVTWSLDRPWKPSWVYERMEAAGWIDYRSGQ